MTRDARGAGLRGRTPGTVALMALLAFQGVSGVAGGLGLAGDPSGRALGFPLAWLEGSPFDSYLVPGLVLLTVLGAGPLLVLAGVWRGVGRSRTGWAWWGAVATGVALLVWLAVEIAVVGYIPAPPLQLVYGLVGAAILATAILPAVRSELRGRPPRRAGT